MVLHLWTACDTYEGFLIDLVCLACNPRKKKNQKIYVEKNNFSMWYVGGFSVFLAPVRLPNENVWGLSCLYLVKKYDGATFVNNLWNPKNPNIGFSKNPNIGFTKNWMSVEKNYFSMWYVWRFSGFPASVRLPNENVCDLNCLSLVKKYDGATFVNSLWHIWGFFDWFGLFGV